MCTYGVLTEKQKKTYLNLHQIEFLTFYFSVFLQIDQEGLTLPERSLYLGQDEDSVKVNKIQWFCFCFMLSLIIFSPHFNPFISPILVP